jgi:phosphatidylglycerol:prolipoprotein diacylglycerol transferase
MHPIVHVFGAEFPSFGLMMLAGVGVAFLVVVLQCKMLKISALDPILTGSIALVGVMIGAFLLRPIMRIPEIIFNWGEVTDRPFGEFIGWMFGEMVFYGGLIGGVLAAMIFCRGYKISFLPIADLFGAAIPAGHVFGRMGCFLGGCCYGMEVDASHPFAVVYPPRTDAFEAAAAPAGVPLLAVPLLEAVGNLVIAGIVLLFIYCTRNNTKPGRGIALYGLLYAPLRFILEYTRGDQVRGVYNGISTSQMISIMIFAFSAILFLLPLLRKRRNL